MEGSSKVTSVIVAFNNEGTVGKCIQSVLKEDYPENETIVVYDEGSSDGTGEEIKKTLAANSGGFCLVSIPHTGRSAARNIGWRKGTGEIVFFADADDLYEPDYIGKAVEALSAENIGCVCVTGASLVEGRGIAPRMLKIYSLVQQRTRVKSQFRPSWAWVYRRKALVEAGGFDERLSQAEDKDLFERVEQLGYQVAVVGGVHWFHRRPSSSTAYFKKTFTGGVRRIPYLTKHSDYAGFIRATGIIWVLAGAFFLQFIFPLTVVVLLIILAAVLAYRGISTASLTWGATQDKPALLIYPFFNLVSHTVSALGTLLGLLRYAESALSPRRRTAVD